MDIKIDHATLCAPELDPLQKALADAGLSSNYGGPHANAVTHMALLGFEDGSYLELIAPLESGRANGSAWEDLMLGNSGPGAWAIRSSNIHAEVARLRSLGVKTAGPEAGGRRLADGKMLEWETASVGPGSPGAMLPFLIQDHTPREWRVQPSASVTGSGLTGIAVVVLGVKDLPAAAVLFQRAYGWDAPLTEDHAEFGAKLAHFPGTPVMLAAPLAESSWLTSRLRNFGEIPAAFLLNTADLQHTAKRFQLSGKTNWFGREIKWFDAAKFAGTKLGVLRS